MNTIEKKHFGEGNIISVEGVGLVIKNTKGDIALVLENEKKAWKRPGQWSIVFETIEEKDSSLEEAVKRALKEELGISLGEEKIWFSEQIIPFIVYDSKNDTFYKVKIYLYDVSLSSKQVIEAKNFKSKEIKAINFYPLGKILSKDLKLRPGTLETLLGYSEGFYIKDGEYWSNTKKINFSKYL